MKKQKKPLEKLFNNLSILEELLEKLQTRKKMSISDSQETVEALKCGIDQTRKQVKALFGAIKANYDYRLPEKKLKPRGVEARERRESKADVNFYLKLEDYFDNN